MGGPSAGIVTGALANGIGGTNGGFSCTISLDASTFHSLTSGFTPGQFTGPTNFFNRAAEVAVALETDAANHPARLERNGKAGQ